MAIKSTRQFIAALQKTGDIVEVNREVDWDLEVGAVVRRLNETQGPAALFNKVKDYPEGYRILGAPLATYRRMAIAMSLPPETPIREVRSEFERRMASPVRPVLIRREDAPCKQNILMGEDIDLFRFPVPIVHDGDGGRYIGTWHAVIARDPDTGWVNWGMYRVMVYNFHIITAQHQPFTDHWSIVQKYFARGKPAPVVIAISMDPMSTLMAMTPIPRGVDECEFAGGLLEEPVELVKAELSDIPVPAHAEIIIEAELTSPNFRLIEGPFGEFTGYRSSPRAPRNAYMVKAVTFRNDPILTVSNMGVPVDDGHIGMSLGMGWDIKKRLQGAGVPITDVYMPPEAAGLICVVGVRPLYNGIAAQVGNIIGMAATNIPPHIIVVEDDVDPFNMQEVIHALGTKCHPLRGITIRPREAATPLTPFLSLEERKWAIGPKAIYDCTWPLEWSRETEVPPKVSFENVYPAAIKEKVLKNWASDGFASPSGL
ncbi:MAG TPA: UbiD family decarboxylase [Dehalococcoidia bacterium]|nr:UbiD family decarboxylase [Dehalococcoidia bacterium]